MLLTKNINAEIWRPYAIKRHAGTLRQNADKKRRPVHAPEHWPHLDATHTDTSKPAPYDFLIMNGMLSFSEKPVEAIMKQENTISTYINHIHTNQDRRQNASPLVNLIV